MLLLHNSRHSEALILKLKATESNHLIQSFHAESVLLGFLLLLHFNKETIDGCVVIASLCGFRYSTYPNMKTNTTTRWIIVGHAPKTRQSKPPP